VNWEIIKRQRGVKPPLSAESVSLGWRLPSGGATHIAFVTVSKALVAKLEWSKPLFLLVQRAPAQGLVRLSPSEHEDAYAGGWKRETVSCGFPLPGVQSEKRPARAVTWEREGDSLVLTLPDWAAPERAGLNGARLAQQQAIERMRTEPRIVPSASLVFDRSPPVSANRARQS
jgi:hypothetical protein